MRTIWEIIVYQPERQVVASCWREQDVTDVLDQMVRERCTGTNRWQGAALWKEIKK